MGERVGAVVGGLGGAGQEHPHAVLAAGMVLQGAGADCLEVSAPANALEELNYSVEGDRAVQITCHTHRTAYFGNQESAL